MTLDEIGQQLADLRAEIARAHPPEVMTTEQAADFLSVKPDTLYRWRKDAVGPMYSQPTNSVVRYLREDLVAWMQEHRA